MLTDTMESRHRTTGRKGEDKATEGWKAGRLEGRRLEGARLITFGLWAFRPFGLSAFGFSLRSCRARIRTYAADAALAGSADSR